MTIEDLNYIQTCSVAPEQYDLVLTDGTKVGYIRERHGSVECHPYDIITQKILWENDLLFLEDVNSLTNTILTKCGKEICKYHNRLLKP